MYLLSDQPGCCIHTWPTIQDAFRSKLEQLSIKYRCSQQVRCDHFAPTSGHSQDLLGRTSYFGGEYLVLEDCRGALEAMPTGNLFAEYYDHEPSKRGQPSISLSIQFPIGQGIRYKFPLLVEFCRETC